MLLHGLDEMPKPKELMALGEIYKPYRSVAAWYMWRAAEMLNSKAAPTKKAVAKKKVVAKKRALAKRAGK